MITISIISIVLATILNFFMIRYVQKYHKKIVKELEDNKKP